MRTYKSLHVELFHVGLLLHHGFNGDGRTTVRPYKLLHVRSLHVRSLHVNCYCIVVLVGTDARPCVPTYRYTSYRYTSNRYTSGLLHVNCYSVVVLTGTDAQTVRPYISLHVKSLHVGVVTRQMLQRWVVTRRVITQYQIK